MAYQNILVETVEGGVGIITLNRPEVLNALSFALTSELDQALTEFEADADIRAVVITGTGEKAFSAGGDIHEMAAATPEEAQARREGRKYQSWHIANVRFPTIGAINGLAFGGAALLSSSLDIRIGCERSKFRFLAAQYGRLNSSWTLPTIVGWARAKELIYTTRLVEAEEAAQIGLLNKLVPSDQLMDTAIAMARQIAKNSPEVVQGAKRLMNENMGRNWEEMYQAEIDLVDNRITLPPVKVGFAEFLARKGRN